MSATSVGEIGLDLVVNKNQFNKQMTGIQSLAKKTGATLVSAFAVKKLVDFGKQCIELGSELQEVQNVVDVTFPNMSEKVNEFSKSAAASFGLSETMAKKFTGTFGSMAKAFGFSEEQAYEMGTALTGLAGDVASFYNLTQDEAYTKLKSVFTGETESLKDLGVVMTQTALDSYALANGFGKTTKSMSEAEKVALRYAFVQAQLTAASGDFNRTSDGWANQIRVLKLQFESLKASLGQGLINLLTPVLKVINTILGKLAVLADGFKAFTELLTGKKSSDTQMSGAIKDAESLTDSVAGVEEAAKKSAKAMKSLAGFDELNNLNSSSSSGGGDGGATGGSGIDFGSLAKGETILDKTDNQLQGLTDKAKELQQIFKKGFQISFGDSKKKFEDIKQSIKSVGKSLKSIATDSSVRNAFSSMLDSIALMFGKYAGSVSSIGITIADNLTSGISDSLNKNASFIKERLVAIFDVGTEISQTIGDFYQAVAEVFSVFSSDNAKAITSDFVSAFTTTFLSLTQLCGQYASDMVSVIITPFVNNAENIKSAAETLLSPVAKIVDTVSQSIQKAWQDVLDMYEADIQPLFQSLSEGISEIVATATRVWKEDISPTLDDLADKFTEVYEKYIDPTISEAIDLIGEVGQTLTLLWENILQPFIIWCQTNIMPILSPIFRGIGTAITEALASASMLIGGLLKSLKGLLQFVQGVFTRDWDKAWTGVKNIFAGKFQSLVACVRNPINQIIRALNLLLGGLNKIKFDIPDWVPVIGGKKFNINISKIPLLAQGGFVKANTPQLAIIGDNRHQGEIVSPEDKLEEMALKAAQMAGSNQDNAYLQQMILLLKQQNELLMQLLEKEIGISDSDIFSSVRKSAASYKNRTGNPAFSY